MKLHTVQTEIMAAVPRRTLEPDEAADMYNLKHVQRIFGKQAVPLTPQLASAYKLDVHGKRIDQAAIQSTFSFRTFADDAGLVENLNLDDAGKTCSFSMPGCQGLYHCG